MYTLIHLTHTHTTLNTHTPYSHTHTHHRTDTQHPTSSSDSPPLAVLNAFTTLLPKQIWRVQMTWPPSPRSPSAQPSSNRTGSRNTSFLQSHPDPKLPPVQIVLLLLHNPPTMLPIMHQRNPHPLSTPPRKGSAPPFHTSAQDISTPLFVSAQRALTPLLRLRAERFPLTSTGDITLFLRSTYATFSIHHLC